MKTIYRIAKLELSTLFYSPVAWLVIVVFIIQSGWEYIDLLDRFERAQQLGMAANGLTSMLFGGWRGVFPTMQSNLFLYIPLLTMGLISREVGSGSIKLLYSSPIKIESIILGKYAAMVVFCLLLISVLFILGIITSFTVENVEFSFFLSGLLGLFLLICAYSAIGLFMSCLTSYQVVAAISTLILLGALNFVGKLWQNIEFVSDITFFLSISGRSNQFIDGLIDSKDIFYFIIVIILFLGLSILKLQSDRESKGLLFKMGRYSLFVAIILVLGYISSRPDLTIYLDMTANKRNTLTEESKAVVKKFDSPVTLTTYINILDENLIYHTPESKNQYKKSYEKYTRFMPDLKIEYVYYYDKVENETLYKQNPGLNEEQLAKKVATTYQMDLKDVLRPDEIKKRIDLKNEGNRIVHLLTYKDKSTFLRIYNDLMKQPDEKEISAALKRLIITPPKIVVVSGQNERSIDRLGDHDYKIFFSEQTFRHSLINQGFDVMELNIKANSIPPDISLLVIADLKEDLDSLVLRKIEDYADKGGNLFIAGEPTRQQYLNPLLKKWGVQLLDGTLVQKSRDYNADFIMAQMDTVLFDTKSAFFRNATISMPGASGVEYTSGTEGYTVKPVAYTFAENTWVETGQIPLKLEDSRSDTEKKTIPTIVSLTKQKGDKEQRILICGDADFISNKEIFRTSPGVSNFKFAYQIFRWYSYNQFPIDTNRPGYQDNNILISSTQVDILKYILIGVFPSIIVLLVGALLIRRKRR